MLRQGGLAALALVLTLPGPAEALSCRRPDIARTYQSAAEAPDTYIVVLGTLDYDSTRLPLGKDRTPPQGKSIPARLQGRGVTATGFSAWIDRPVTLDIHCVSAWCGGAPKGEQMLMFLRRADGGYRLDLGPCPQFVFPNPSAADFSTLRQCLAGGRCQPRR